MPPSHHTASAIITELVIDLHPYEVPNITAVPITTGSPAYLAWINESTDGHKSDA